MTNYQVFATPLKLSGVYGHEVEISDWLLSDNIGEITRAIDSTDFDVGVYATNDVTLVFEVSDGYLNGPADSRSLFQYSRDLAKVRLVFLKDGIPLTTFYGLLNEEGSSLDAQSATLSIVVMGYESVLRKAVIAAGAVQDGYTFQQAFISILNSAVGGVLNVNADDINPVYNGTVDLGSYFANKSAKDGLNDLLLAANSILVVDKFQNAYVRSRTETTNQALYLHGKGDLLGRENIQALQSYNDGLQRTFNLIRVTGGQPATVVSGQTVSTPALIGIAQDGNSIARYRLRIKELTVAFVTEQTTLDAIAAAILVEFSYPKEEVEVRVATELLQAQFPPYDLLDRVSINYPLTVRPMPGKRLPICGITRCNDASSPLPYIEGAVVIDLTTAWKIIEIRENPMDFTSVLKLRVKGSSPTDGTFDFIMTEDGSLLETESGENIAA